MYSVNDIVIYGTHGVCKITEISKKVFINKTKEYYILKPVSDSRTTLYLPADNDALLSKIRRVLSKQEIDEIINFTLKEDTEWISNELERREKFKAILADGTHSDLIKMIKIIWLQKQKREAEGKKIALNRLTLLQGSGTDSF